jgi:hypothetical protein
VIPLDANGKVLARQKWDINHRIKKASKKYLYPFYNSTAWD